MSIIKRRLSQEQEMKINEINLQNHSFTFNNKLTNSKLYDSNNHTKKTTSTEIRDFSNYLNTNENSCYTMKSNILDYSFKGQRFLPTKNHLKKKYNNSISIDSINIMETIKKNRENEREKKIYEQKLKAIKLRIQNLKNKEDEFFKKKKTESIKESNFKKIKNERRDLKKYINIIHNDMKKKLDEKKKKVNEERLKTEIRLKTSKINSRLKKINKYNQIKKEKSLYDSIIYDNNYRMDTIKKEKIKNIKDNRNNIKLSEEIQKRNIEEQMKEFYYQRNEYNKRETDKIKEELKKLEKIEEKYKDNMRKENIDYYLISDKHLKPKTLRSKSTLSNKSNYYKKPFIAGTPNHKDDFYYTHRPKIKNSII